MPKQLPTDRLVCRMFNVGLECNVAMTVDAVLWTKRLVLLMAIAETVLCVHWSRSRVVELVWLSLMAHRAQLRRLHCVVGMVKCV